MESSTWQNLFEQARTVLAPVEEDLEPGEKEHLKKRREELKRQRVIKHRTHQRSAEHDRTRLRDTEAVMRADEFDPSLDEEEKKFKVRVRNRHTNRTDVRMATRSKINKLRASKEISSVEMTGHGVAKEQKPVQKKKPISTASNVKKESTEVPSGNVKKLVSKAVKRVDTDVDGDVDHNDKQKGPLGEFVPDPSGKKRVYSGVKKEGFSNWRDELREIKDVDDNDVKKIDTKKKVKNKIIINPKLGEEVEQLGGKLISLAEKKGGKCDDCSCEGCGQNPCVECGEDHHNLDEASYPGYDEKGKKKDDRLTVTHADKKANTPAYQKYKAGDKRYKAADHLKNEEAGGAEDKGLKAKQQKQSQIKKQILLKKMQAVRSGGGEDIQASYQPDVTKEEIKMTKKAYNKLHKDFKSDDPKKPRTTKYNPKTGGTESHPVKFVDEAKVDTGKSADEKATARNQRNNPKKGDPGFGKFATSVFIKRKEGQSLAWGKDSAASEKRREAHAKKRGIKEKEGALHEDEYRRMLAKERQTEKQKELKRGGPKSVTPGKNTKNSAKSYADQQKQSIDYHDKKSKNNKIVVGMVKEQGVDEAKVDTGSAEEKATARNKRNTPPGKDSKFDTSVFITRKPGESLDSARTRTRQKAHAAKRGVKEGFKTLTPDKKRAIRNQAERRKKSADRAQMASDYTTSTKQDQQVRKMKKVSEDKAFDNVVSMLRKKHGESGVLTKDSPKPKPQPKAKPKPQKPLSAKEKAQREVDAQYGGAENRKAGRGLGT